MSKLIIERYGYFRPKNRRRNTDRSPLDADLHPWPLKCRSHREKVWQKRLARIILRSPR